MFDFIFGLIIMLGTLSFIGITKQKFMNQKNWLIIWTIISIMFASFIVVAFILYNPVLINLALGGSLGFVLAIAIHVIEHTIRESYT
jgi:hypothetical protein